MRGCGGGKKVAARRHVNEHLSLAEQFCCYVTWSSRFRTPPPICSRPSHVTSAKQLVEIPQYSQLIIIRLNIQCQGTACRMENGRSIEFTIPTSLESATLKFQSSKFSRHKYLIQPLSSLLPYWLVHKFFMMLISKCAGKTVFEPQEDVRTFQKIVLSTYSTPDSNLL